ncbi:MAG: helix-turn-helix transcriptional regulator [Pyrinomonadaceae bacterium]
MSKALADFVRKTRLANNLTTSDVERISEGAISDSYISRIENGHVANVSPDKLNALAKGLKISTEEIYRIARGLSPEGPKERLEILAETFDGQDLNDSDWAEIEAVLKILIDQKRAMRSAVTKQKKP